VGYDDLREAIVRVRPPNDLVSHHARPSPFASGVHPGLVLADLVANRLRPLLRGSWAEVRRGARHRLGVSVELPAARVYHRHLPTIAAAGPPRSRLRARLEGRHEPAVPPPPGLRWTEEQAEHWIMALQHPPRPSPRQP
jgi:hypothetical protein